MTQDRAEMGKAQCDQTRRREVKQRQGRTERVKNVILKMTRRAAAFSSARRVIRKLLQLVGKFWGQRELLHGAMKIGGF